MFQLIWTLLYSDNIFLILYLKQYVTIDVTMVSNLNQF